MALAKLMIFVGSDLIPVVALFNPTEFTVQKTVPWVEQPTAGREGAAEQYTHSGRATLSLDLFFDTYEIGVDVRAFTQRIVRVASVDPRDPQQQHPLVCKLVWGLGGVVFQGVLQSLTQRYTLFLPSGTPVRATLGCTFLEWKSDWDKALRKLSALVDVSNNRALQVGESLSSIAASEYRDPTDWRRIAEANGIDDPRAIGPGRALTIPRRQG